MGFVHSTQIQNKYHPHPHPPDAIASTGFAPIRCCCNLPSKAPSSKRLPSGHKSPISTVNDVTNRTINKSNNYVSTVPKKTIIIPLPYLGLRSRPPNGLNLVLCQPWSMFSKHSPHQIFLSYKDRLNRSQQSKVIKKPVIGIVKIYTLVKLT